MERPPDHDDHERMAWDLEGIQGDLQRQHRDIGEQQPPSDEDPDSDELNPPPPEPDGGG